MIDGIPKRPKPIFTKRSLKFARNPLVAKNILKCSPGFSLEFAMEISENPVNSPVGSPLAKNPHGDDRKP